MFTTLPLSLIRHCNKHGLLQELKVFTYLKLYCSNNPKSSGPAFNPKALRERLGIKSIKTFRKYLQSLQALNWVGCNDSANILHVRSYRRIISIIGSSEKAAVRVKPEDLKRFRAFATAALVTKLIRDTAKHTLIYSRSRKYKGSLSKRDEAKPVLNYFGLSNEGFAALLYTSKTTAVERKQEAVKAGYIKTRKRYHKEYELSKEEAPFYIKHCKQVYGPAKCVRKLKGKYWLCTQQHDEVIPLLKICKSSQVKKTFRLHK